MLQLKVIDKLLDRGVDESHIAVLSPYRAQCSEIVQRLTRRNLKQIVVATIMGAQGKPTVK